MSDSEQGETAPAAVPPAAAIPGEIEGAPDIFVKGGTTSLAWDLQQQQLDAQGDAARAAQDRRRQAVTEAASSQDTVASLVSLEFGSDRHPIIVLTYVKKDSALNQECQCELLLSPLPDDPSKFEMTLTLVCPRCLERTGRQSRSTSMIRSTVREFYLDATKAGHWVHPMTGQFFQLAGTVTTRDAISCDAVGCTWRFRIDDSKLYEV